MIQWTPIEAGDIPTYLAFLIAGLAAFFAWRTLQAQRKQYREDADRRDQADRISHAQGISSWFDDSSGDNQGNEQVATMSLLNNSPEPVYDVVVSMVFVQGAGPAVGEDLIRGDLTDHLFNIAVLPPGRWQIPAPDGWRGMSRFPGAEIAFTDRAGVSWIRRSRGKLVEIPRPAVAYFGIDLPVGYTKIIRDTRPDFRK